MITEDATSKDDLKTSIAYLKSRQITDKLQTLINELEEFQQLLEEFQVVLNRCYPSSTCNDFKKIGLGLACLITGIGCLVAAVCLWPVGAAAAGAGACVAGSYVTSLGAAAGGALLLTGSAFMGKSLLDQRGKDIEARDQIDQMLARIKRDVTSSEKMRKQLAKVKSNFFTETDNPEQIAFNLLKRFISNRLNKIIEGCETLLEG